jgi:hypothetical protein
MNKGTGQTNWSAKGSLQPRFPSMPATARTTPDERRIPAPQHMQTYAVTYGRRIVGTTSEAYVVESVYFQLACSPYWWCGEASLTWKTPHGIPHMASPKAKTESEGAKTGMNRTTAIQTINSIIVGRQPNLSWV